MGMRVGFIGFGEAGRAFQRSLAGHDSSLSFVGYDLLLDSEGPEGDCRAAMAYAGVEVADTPEAMVRDADWIISAVTADQSRNAAQSVAPFVRPGQVFFDINSVSPNTKRANAKLVAAGGAGYIDMAVMAPVHPAGHRTPVLVAGPLVAEDEARLRRLGFACEQVGPEAGAATAIKMVRSLFVKGLEAITVQALAAAALSGCYERVLASLSGSYPGLGWPGFAAYEAERVTTHGIRRAAEMRESARAMADIGVGGDLAAAIADLQQRVGDLRLAKAGDDLAVRYREIGRGLQEGKAG